MNWVPLFFVNIRKLIFSNTKHPLQKAQLFAILVICSLFGFISLNLFGEEENLYASVSVLREDNFRAHSSACDSKLFEPAWKGHFLSHEEVNSSHSDIVPTTFEDVLLGIAPTIPRSFLIEEQNFCRKNTNLKAIAYVSTTIINTEQRILIRQGFEPVADIMGVVFFVGKAVSKEEEDIITEENHLYHDIVQGNFTDSYNLLVYKSLNALYWLKKNCNYIKWVIHIDDDVALDTSRFLRVIKHLEKDVSSNKIFCNFKCRLMPQRKGKYQVTTDEYPYGHFPAFCFGTMWFTTMDVVAVLLDSVPRVKFLHLEDVFITGFLAESAAVQRHYTHALNHLSIRIN